MPGNRSAADLAKNAGVAAPNGPDNAAAPTPLLLDFLARRQVPRDGRSVSTRFQEILYGGRSKPFGDSVKISTPESVTPTVCSNWAESERSRVTAVQPSDNTFT
jgi:hypothetical protein